MRALPSVWQGSWAREFEFSQQSMTPNCSTLTTDALEAACGSAAAVIEMTSPLEPNAPAMAFQIMMAVAAGERDPEQLKLAALNATAGRSLNS